MSIQTIAGLRARRAELVSEAKVHSKDCRSELPEGASEYDFYDNTAERNFDRLAEEIEAIDRKIEETKKVNTQKVLRGTPVSTHAFGSSSFATASVERNFASPKKDHGLPA